MAKKVVKYGDYGQFLKNNFSFEKYKDKIIPTNKISQLQQVYDDAFCVTFSMYYVDDVTNPDLFIHTTSEVLPKAKNIDLPELDYMNNVIIPITFTENSDPPVVKQMLRSYLKCQPANTYHKLCQEKVKSFMDTYLEFVKPTHPIKL